MTLQDIAEIADVNEITVRRWAAKASDKMSGLRDKLSDAQQTKVSAQFTVNEVIEIVRAGGRKTFAGLLLDNANLSAGKTFETTKPGKLPSGAQLREMRLTLGNVEAGKRIDHIIGYTPKPVVRVSVPAPKALTKNEEVEAQGLLFEIENDIRRYKEKQLEVRR